MIHLPAAQVLAAVRDGTDLPPVFCCELLVDDAPVLAASLSRRGYTSQWPAEPPGSTVTLKADGQRFSGPVDPT